VLARGGAVVQRLAAREGAREAHCGDRGLVDQRFADLDAAGLQQRERRAGQAALRRGGGELARHDGARARVRGMALDDHRAAGGQRAGRVAARGREGEREVAGAEHRDGPDRHEHAPHVGPRDRLGVRVRGVDDRLDVVAGVDDRGERLQLARGALELATQARLGQAGLAARDRHDLVPCRTQPPGGHAQERGACSGIAQLARAEDLVRGGDGLVDVGPRGLLERGSGLARAGIDGVEGA
jgi:hypothetical protein